MSSCKTRLVIATVLRRLENTFLDSFFPRRCVNCSVVGSWSCKKCIQEAGEAHTNSGLIAQYPVFSLLDFNQPLVRKLLHQLKYGGITEAAGDLINLAIGDGAVLTTHLPAHSLFIPVPSSSKSMRNRGYNQAQLLAEELGRRLDIPVWGRALARKSGHTTQVGKGAEARSAQVLAFYHPNQTIPTEYMQRNWILIDDLRTTGSTLAGCLACLVKVVSSQDNLSCLTISWNGNIKNKKEKELCI